MRIKEGRTAWARNSGCEPIDRCGILYEPEHAVQSSNQLRVTSVTLQSIDASRNLMSNAKPGDHQFLEVLMRIAVHVEVHARIDLFESRYQAGGVVGLARTCIHPNKRRQATSKPKPIRCCDAGIVRTS